jgi:predicted secreted protein
LSDSNAHIGAGAELQKGQGDSPETFISVMGIKSITGPQISRDSVETTDMQSNGWREFIGGLKDGGEVTFDANFLPRDATQNQEDGGFMAEFDKSSCDSRGNWRILLPECQGEPEGFFEFAAIVTGQQVEVPLDDVMAFSGTLKVSGRPQLVLESA